MNQQQPRAHASGKPSRSWTDIPLLVLAVAAAGYLIGLSLPAAGTPLVTVATLLVAALLMLILALAFALAAIRRGTLQPWWRLPAALLALGLVALAAQRWTAWQRALEAWPPVPDESLADDLDRLEPHQRARWGVELAAHVLADRPDAAGSPAIPAEWPFPEGITLAVESSAVATHVWARTTEGATACTSLPLAAQPLDSPDSCENRQVPLRALFAPPDRPTLTPPTSVEVATTASWRQYRNDAARTGTSPAERRLERGWVATTIGGIRASVSVVGRDVLVGGHGIGALTVLDLESGALRWSARLPNWIHQDPASDGAVVVVGFGDNDGSFSGRAPSGVAAYELASGRHLWTAFERNSIMTSVALHDSGAVYVTGDGTVRIRELRTGRLRAESRVPGGAIMAPVVLAGDTAVTTLDRARVCALTVPDLVTIWCRHLKHMRMLGHSAASIASGRVYLSGQTTLLSLTPRDWPWLGRGLQARLVRRSLEYAGDHEVIAGVQLWALELSTGATAWVSPNFAYDGHVNGHISGTPVMVDSVGVVVLPNADRLVAFRAPTGETLWSHPSRKSRGPPLVADGHVVLAGGDGVIEVRRLLDGGLACTLTRATGWDRAGPALAAGLAIFADRRGVVEAIPFDDLAACRLPGAEHAGRD